MNFSVYIKRHSLIALLLLLAAISSQLFGQATFNLVPNNSFEEYTNCPSYGSLGEIKASKPDYWYKPDLKFATYYHVCAGIVPVHTLTSGPSFQYPRTGSAYIGMFYYNGSNARNYFQVQLEDSLRAGKCYYAECFVSLGNSWKLASNNQSMLFTQYAVYADTAHGVEFIPGNPQVTNFWNPVVTDTGGWVKVSGVFVAAGGEQFLTLGNFRDNAQTSTLLVNPAGGYNGAGYYVDDVSVFPVDSFPISADAGPDRTIQQGESTYIGTYTAGLTSVNWYNSSGALIVAGVSGFNATPVSNTFYVIEQTICGYYSRDTVYVNVQPLPVTFLDYAVQLTSKFSVQNRWTTTDEVNVSHYTVQRSRDGITFYSIGTVPAKTGLLNEYSFTDENPFPGKNYYRAVSFDKDGRKEYSSIKYVEITAEVSELHVYPNPAADAVMIEQPDIRQVTLYDISGRVVLQQYFPSVHLCQIDISRLTNGIYLVKVRNGAGLQASQRLVVK